MLQNAFSIQPFEAKRVRFESTRPFDEVLLNLRKLVGTAIPQKVNKQESGGGTREHFEILGETYLAAMQELGGISREHFEKAVQSQVGESGFMLFYEIDHGEWLPLFGIQRKVVRWILGNPLIAITMMRHDITAGLFAPVELFLVENESGDGSTVIYDLPSSLMAIERNPALLEAAHALDGKLQALVSRVTGVELDRTPDQRNHSH
jgi:uncharacterized protein (DUF302 family)